MFIHVFLLQVSKAAFNYQHLNDNLRFNEAVQVVKFRTALNANMTAMRPRIRSPTQSPKLKKAKIVLHRCDTPFVGASKATEDKPDGYDDDRSSSNSDATTFVMNREGSKESSKTGGPEPNCDVEEEPAAGTSTAESKSSPCTPGSGAAAGTRSKSGTKKSRYEELVDFATTGGGTINEIIAGLNIMLEAYKRRRKRTKRVKADIAKVNELILYLYQTPVTEPWRDSLVKYQDVLKRM